MQLRVALRVALLSNVAHLIAPACPTPGLRAADADFRAWRSSVLMTLVSEVCRYIPPSQSYKAFRIPTFQDTRTCFGIRSQVLS